MASPFHIIKVQAGNTFFIGRNDDCDLVLPDRLVSRRHAQIDKAGDDWILKNLSLTTGTRVNGNSIDKVILQDDDILLVGLQQIRVFIKNGGLTLQHIRSLEDIEPISLSETVPVFLGRRAHGEHSIAIKHPACPALFASAILKSGKCVLKFAHGKRMELEENAVLKLPWCLLEFREGALRIHQKDTGISVCVQHAGVKVKGRELLKGMHFSLPAGEILAIIGRSGQGKSTLLRLFAGKHECATGTITFDGIPYSEKHLQEQVATLPQEPLLREALNVRETLRHTARITLPADYTDTEIDERLKKLTSLFALDNLENHSVATLSGGERRRTALAAQLMGAPGLILLDEPLAGLDPVNAKILCTHLRKLALLGHTVILTTHGYEALRVADKVLVLHGGEEAFFGTPQEAYDYFNAADPETILESLTERSGESWEASGRKTARIEESSGKILFPKVPRREFFFYFLRLLSKQWFRDKGKTIALILQPVIIAFLLSQIFSENSSFWIVAFALILCANWFALSLSIREFVQEKELIIEEFRSGLPVFPVLCAKAVFPFFFALLQTLICYAAIAPKTGLTPPALPALAAISTTLIASVSLGLLTSASSRNPGQANAFLPILIIPQIALAGALVPVDEMDGIARIISYAIPARYTQTALQNLFTGTPAGISDILLPLGIAAIFYIVTFITLHQMKKAK
ncbi:MAG: ATP-binding cassette domain-containing protein [Fibrobacteraceae bacterium]